MDFRLIQDAERQMLRDGKSAAAIDAMKSAYRKQMFNPDGYSQTAGLGSFASGGEASGPPPVSGPVPQGIASFQDGGEAESFFSRFNPLTGSYRKKKPLSVRAAETAIDFTPLAAVKTGQEIYEESQSEDPSLLKMGIMAAGEAAGLIPIAGPAVKTMVRRVPADLADDIAGLNRRPSFPEINDYRLNLERNTDLSPDEIDVRVENYTANQEGAVSGAVRELTDTERLADEIAADLRAGNTDLVTDERLEELDFLGEIRLRQHYIDGNVGVDADGVPITLDNAEREARMLAQGYDRVGVHGTMPTQEGVSVDDIRVMRPSTYGKSGRGVYLDVEPTGMNFGDGEIVNPSGIPYPTANRFAGYNPDPRSIDRGKGAADRIPEGSQMYPLVQRGPFAKSTDYTAARKELLQQNPDLDTVELDRLANQRLMDQGFAGVDSTHYGEITSFEGGNLRSPTAIFDPRLTDLKNIGMADGGAVMSGIGTLNETARNMTRGPRGIGAYQQFADGGVVPRQTVIGNQPHMLAYINPEEAQLLQDLGGTGEPGPGGVPAYRNMDADMYAGSNYAPTSNAGTASASQTFSNQATSTGNFFNTGAASNNSDDGPGYSQPYNPSGPSNAEIAAQQAAAQQAAAQQAAAQQAAAQAAAAEAARQEAARQGAIELASKTATAKSALKGSGITGLRPQERPKPKTGIAGLLDSAMSLYNNLPQTRIFRGIANDVTMGFRAGFGNAEEQRKRLENATDSEGNPLYSPFEIDEYFIATEASKARQAEQQNANRLNKSDDGPGLSQSCPPGYVFDSASGQCVPISGQPFSGNEENTIKYASDYLDNGISSGLPPAPVYIESSFVPNTQMFAEGGEVDEVSARRASAEDLDNLSKMVRETYGFDPVAVALEQGIDPELALRVMYEESKGNQSAGSEKGARGLMQLMPGTAEELGVDINDALDNYTGGLKYLKKMTDQFGLEVGLAAYNAGPGNVAEYQGVPPFKETQNYLRIIAEPFTGNSVEGLINTGAENFIMNQPVFNAEDVARGRGVRPMSRPPEIEFSAPATSLRPMARPEELVEPELEEIDAPLQSSRQNLREKYSLANMAEALTQQEPVGIMSATR